MSTRHVTLCVTHPGGAGHLTLDHHVPASVAEELKTRVRYAWVPRGGRHVSLITTPDDEKPLPRIETDDDTADALVAWLLPHMPPSVQDALR